MLILNNNINIHKYNTEDQYTQLTNTYLYIKNKNIKNDHAFYTNKS